MLLNGILWTVDLWTILISKFYQQAIDFLAIQDLKLATKKDIVKSSSGKNSNNVYLYLNNVRLDNNNSFDQLNHVGQGLSQVTNLNDNSLFSECFSGHMMTNFLSTFGFQVELGGTETTLVYNCFGSRVSDYVLTVTNQLLNTNERVAVQVKRVHNFNGNVRLDRQYMFSLLDHANLGAHLSNQNVSDEDLWNCQVLHLLTSDVNVQNYVQQWLNSTTDSGFLAVFTTVVTGNYSMLF